MQDELKYWLAINQTNVLGPINFLKIINFFKSAEEAWKKDKKDYLKIIEEALADKFVSNKKDINPDKLLETVYKEDIKVITHKDKNYPHLLKEIYAPPPVLYCKGSLNFKNCFAIVGTRRPSFYGQKMADYFSSELAKLGFTIVSGLARGIDSICHQGALKEGRTIAVLGSGVDVIYPPENKKLYEKIIENGAVISEFPLNSTPISFHFPLRNRIITGLCKGVLIIEADYKSGAMISAKIALEQNREVFALPGQALNPLSRGPHWLIKQGAKLTENVEDILEELDFLIKPIKKIAKEKIPPNLSEEEKKIYEKIKEGEGKFEELFNSLKFPLVELNCIITTLEVKGLIKRLPGNCFEIT